MVVLNVEIIFDDLSLQQKKKQTIERFFARKISFDLYMYIGTIKRVNLLKVFSRMMYQVHCTVYNRKDMKKSRK